MLSFNPTAESFDLIELKGSVQVVAGCQDLVFFLPLLLARDRQHKTHGHLVSISAPPSQFKRFFELKTSMKQEAKMLQSQHPYLV